METNRDEQVSRPDNEDTAIRSPSEAAEQGPDEPTDIPARNWGTVLKRTAKEFKAD
jgi:hypothetical protein